MSNLSTLNDKQSQAVKSRSKNILVLAGAGTGKTKVLTSRVSYLIEMGVSPEEIFAVTFTNKASKEMKDRIINMLPKDIHIGGAWIGTFHNLCNKIIKAHHNLLGLPINYQIFDSDDQKSTIRRSIDEYENENSIKLDKKEVIQETLSFINKAKENGLRPNKSLQLASNMRLNNMHVELYEKYEKIKKTSNAIDFSDMILCVVELFTSHKNVLDFYNNKFKHILVDEFQDTDKLQYKLITMMCSNNNYLFVVGDDDQSIYGWRGAEIKNILQFNEKKENVEIIKLEQNYRSTKTILNAANAVISNNSNRHGKNLWSDGEDGDAIKIQLAYSPEQEAKLISEQIDNLIIQGKNPKSIAILYRNNSISRTFEMSLKSLRIPYVIVGGISFWSRKEVKDLLSYLSLVADTNNNISFERIINVPSRGIGKKSIEKIRVESHLRELSMFETLKLMIEEKLIKGKSADNLNGFIKLIERIKNSDISLSIYHTLTMIIEETNIISQYIKEGEEKYEERKENMQELAYAGKTFKRSEDDNDELSDIDLFISQATLQSETSKEKNTEKVNLMTVHASKGLEFPYVFLVGFEDGIFPSARSVQYGDIEEERRLAYVAITRAEKNLSISYSKSRYGKEILPSCFLEELKNKFTKLESKYTIGDVYNHQKYGNGIITKVNNYEITVDFGFSGRKCIMIKK
jgi:DNA helicase II / ATP-dependent DNA helicase PcrA